jgi:hypothetical protein
LYIHSSPTRTANPLQSPTSDELVQALRKPTSQRKSEKDNICRDKGVSPAYYIGDASKGHGTTEIRERVGQGDPIHAADVLELDADAVDAGRNDGGVNYGEEEAETDSGDDFERY